MLSVNTIEKEYHSFRTMISNDIVRCISVSINLLMEIFMTVCGFVPQTNVPEHLKLNVGYLNSTSTTGVFLVITEILMTAQIK